MFLVTFARDSGVDYPFSGVNPGFRGGESRTVVKSKRVHFSEGISSIRYYIFLPLPRISTRKYYPLESFEFYKKKKGLILIGRESKCIEIFENFSWFYLIRGRKINRSNAR